MNYERCKKTDTPCTISLSTSFQSKVERNNFYYHLVNGKQVLKYVQIILLHPQKPNWLRKIKHYFIISQLDIGIIGAHTECSHVDIHHLLGEITEWFRYISSTSYGKPYWEKYSYLSSPSNWYLEIILVVPCKSNPLDKWRILWSLKMITACRTSMTWGHLKLPGTILLDFLNDRVFC